MFKFFKTSDVIIQLIEEYFNLVEQGILIFREGVANYLNGNKNEFNDNIKNISKKEGKADSIRREVENKLYIKSLLPQFRGDVIQLLEKIDDIIDTGKENLSQFDVEVPMIPSALHQDLLKLTELSVMAVEELIPAARLYFRDPYSVKDKLHKVYFYEREADKLANSIKRRVFQEMDDLKLSEKFHLRYFTLHIENVSDRAETVADILSIMAIKRTM